MTLLFGLERSIMSRTATYQIRLDETEKKEAFAIFEELGMTPAQAIRLFFTQVRRTNSIPFAISIPNAQTIQTIEEIEQGKGLNHYQDADDLFKTLGM